MSFPTDPVFSETPTTRREYKTYGKEIRTDVISAVDWLGHRFEVGDRVMYCIGAGRGQMMAIGIVQKIEASPRRDLISCEWETVDGRNRRINEVWEDSWTINVQVLTEKTSGHWNNEKRSRPAWVNAMNITSLKERLDE